MAAVEEVRRNLTAKLPEARSAVRRIPPGGPNSDPQSHRTRPRAGARACRPEGHPHPRRGDRRRSATPRHAQRPTLPFRGRSADRPTTNAHRGSPRLDGIVRNM